MGHLVVLVIGDDYEDQLDKFQNREHADPQNRHWVTYDGLVSARKHYEERSANDVFGKSSFLDWTRKSFGVGVLEEQQEPDLAGLHRNGWIRLNGDGQVTELIHRNIPNSFFDSVSSEICAFPLKKDRSAAIAMAREKARVSWEFRKRFGLIGSWEREPNEAEIDGFTFTDSAAKGDIDLESMRSVIRAAAEERWDRVATACGSQAWQPFDAICERYKKDNYSDMIRKASAEWKEQTAVKSIIEMATRDFLQRRSLNLSRMQAKVAHGLLTNATHETVDYFRLPREIYARRFRLVTMLGYTDVIMHGEHLKEVDEDQLFERIPEETILTLVSVRM